MKAPLLLRSNFSRQHSKTLYRWMVRKRRKTGKHRAVEVKKIWLVLAQILYSLQGNGRQSPRMKTTGIDQPTWRIIQGAGIVKGWKDK